MNTMIDKEDQLWILILFSIVFPPVTAYLLHGWSGKFAINLVLTGFLFVPGTFHALCLIANAQAQQTTQILD